MITRYFLMATKGDKINNEIHFTMNQAEQRQLVLINDGYKTKIYPLKIDLAMHEIQEHYDSEIAKYDILNDLLYILKENHNVPEEDFSDIEEDINIIYSIFLKKSNSEFSHWENIESTIDYLKDVKNTKYNYSKIK